VKIEDSFIDIEFQPERQPIFVITFSYLKRTHRVNLCQINMDQQSGKIEDFLDMRPLITIPQ